MTAQSIGGRRGEVDTHELLRKRVQRFAAHRTVDRPSALSAATGRDDEEHERDRECEPHIEKPRYRLLAKSRGSGEEYRECRGEHGGHR